jgi:hypothetical protein
MIDVGLGNSDHLHGSLDMNSSDSDQGLDCLDDPTCISDPDDLGLTECEDTGCDDDMVCVDGHCIDPPNTCASFPELSTDANLTEFGYEKRYSSGADTEESDCIQNHYENGGDRVVQFTAPYTGTWLFTAKGDHLWSLSARIACESQEALACSSSVNYHGSDPFSANRGFELNVDEGETLYFALDGCPIEYETCEYLFQAHKPIIEGEACNPDGAQWVEVNDAINGCTEGMTCPRYQETPVCIIATPPAIERAEEAQITRMDNRALVTLYGFDQTRDLTGVKYLLFNDEDEVIRLPNQRLDERSGALANYQIYGEERPIIQFIIYLTSEELNRAFDEVKSIGVKLIDESELMSELLMISVGQ